MGYGLTRILVFLTQMYGVILLRRSKLCQTKLEAKFDRRLFVGYPKEVLDIVSTKLWNKGYLFQSMLSS